MVAVLTPKTGGKPIVVDKAVILVGRHPDCDYILQSSRKVSRRHVCIVQVNDKYMVRDLGSMNGISVNGTRVKNVHPIGIGDELSIGDVLFRFEEVQRLPRPPRKQPNPPAAVVPPQSVQSVPDKLPEPDPVPEHMVTPPDEDDLSRNFPVAIPDEGHEMSFVVIDEADGDAPASDEVVVEGHSDPDASFLAIGDLDAVGLKPDNAERQAAPSSDANLLGDGSDLIEPLEGSDLFDLDNESIPLVQGIDDSQDEFEPIADIDDEDVDDVIVLDDP